MSSSGRLRWQSPLGASCLEIAGSDGIRSGAPIFFLTVWFQRERDEALLSVAIMGYVLRSMVKLEAENDRTTKILRTSVQGSSLCGIV
jgi:hypothetical protein